MLLFTCMVTIISYVLCSCRTKLHAAIPPPGMLLFPDVNPNRLGMRLGLREGHWSINENASGELAELSWLRKRCVNVLNLQPTIALGMSVSQPADTETDTEIPIGTKEANTDCDTSTPGDKSNISQLEQDLETYQTQLESFQVESSQQHNTMLAQLKEQHQTELAEQLELLKQQHTQELSALKHGHEQQLAQLKADLEEKDIELVQVTAKLVEEHNSDIALLKDTFGEESREQAEQYVADLQEQQTHISDLEDRLRLYMHAADSVEDTTDKSPEGFLQEAKQLHAEVAATEKEIETMKQEIEEQHQRDLEVVIRGLKEKHEKEVEVLREEYERRSAAEACTCLGDDTTCHSTMTDKANVEAAALSRCSMCEKETMTAFAGQMEQHEEDIKVLRQELQKTYDDELNDMRSLMDAKKFEELENLKNELGQKHELHLAEVTAKYEGLLQAKEDSMQGRIEEEVARVRQETENLLERELDAARDSIKEVLLEELGEDWERERKEHQAKLRELQAKLESDAEEYVKHIGTKDEEIQKLKAKLNQDKSSPDEEDSSSRSETESLQQHQDLQSELEMSESRNKDYEKKLNNMQSRMEELQQIVDNLSKQKADQEDMMDDYEEKIEKLEKRNMEMNERLDQNGKLMERRERELAKLQELKDSFDQERQDLFERLDEYEKRFGEYDGKQREKEARIQELEDLLVQQNQEYENKILASEEEIEKLKQSTSVCEPRKELQSREKLSPDSLLGERLRQRSEELSGDEDSIPECLSYQESEDDLSSPSPENQNLKSTYEIDTAGGDDVNPDAQNSENQNASTCRSISTDPASIETDSLADQMDSIHDSTSLEAQLQLCRVRISELEATVSDYQQRARSADAPAHSDSDHSTMQVKPTDDGSGATRVEAEDVDDDEAAYTSDCRRLEEDLRAEDKADETVTDPELKEQVEELTFQLDQLRTGKYM